jgi:RES domain-containing protein
MRLYRLTHRRDPTDAFSGEGARRVAGRWHPAGVRVVYTSSSVALAVVENLMHLETENLAVFTFIHAVDVPDTLIERPPLATLPADWNQPTRSEQARACGQQWAGSRRSLGLALPSVAVPQEFDVLLNPEHPAFADLVLGDPSPFTFDRRFAGGRAPAPARKARRR